MRKTLLIIPAVLLLALVAAGGLFAYDANRPSQIASGIRVGGIDVGDMAPAVARQRLEEELVAELERPVRVHHGKRTWTLGPREARIDTNVDELVDDALARSQEGGVLGRTMRRLTDDTVSADLEPTVTFSDRAVVRLVDRVRKAIGRPAVDARMQLTASGVQSSQSRRGLAVRASALHEKINAALISPTAERRIAAKTRKLKPAVTTAELAEANPVVLIADRASYTLKVYKGLQLSRTYGIAVGSAGYETPSGQYTIANKAVDPAWTVPDSDWAGDLKGKVIPGGAPDNPLKARWLGIVDGVGIHGTSDEGSVGSNASHGCLRMRVADVVELYPQVPVGAKILIA